jgi:hypothetical protein
MAQRKRFEQTLPPLRVPSEIFEALKARAKATRLPESEIRRMALERALLPAAAVLVDGDNRDGET